MIQFKHKHDFENLQATLFNKKRNNIPLIELGVHPIIKKEILGRPILTLKDDIEFMYNMGYDFVKIQPVIKFPEKQKVDRNADDEYKNAPDRAWATEDTGVITSWADFEKYQWPKIEDIDYSRYDQVKQFLPDSMGVIGQYGDIFTLVWELMGFETFAYATFEQPDLVEAIFDKVSTLVISMFENMVQFDSVGALWYSDDIAFAAGLMIDPDFLRKYFFPCLNKIGSFAKQKNIPLIYHTDGKLWDVMDDIINSGVTALHPIEPKSMDFWEIRDKYSDKLSFCGGIEVDTLARGTKDELQTLIKKYLDTIPGTCSWSAGSSNSIPDYVTVENYLTLLKMVHEYNGHE